MKKIISLLVVAVLSTVISISGFRGGDAQAYRDDANQVRIIHQVVEDIYRDFPNQVYQCSIGGVQFSLGATLYAHAAWEGGLETTSTPYSTNNPGSLHGPQGQRSFSHKICHDNTCNRPVYHNMTDGFYEKAYLIAVRDVYKCNFGKAGMIKYVKGSGSRDTALANRMNDMKNVKAPRYERYVKELGLDSKEHQAPAEEVIEIQDPAPVEKDIPTLQEELNVPKTVEQIKERRAAEREKAIKENAENVTIDGVPATQIPKYRSPTERRYPVNGIFETDDKKCYVLHGTVYAGDDIEILSSSNEFIKDFDTPDTDDGLMKVFNCFDK